MAKDLPVEALYEPVGGFPAGLFVVQCLVALSTGLG